MRTRIHDEEVAMFDGAVIEIDRDVAMEALAVGRDDCSEADWKDLHRRLRSIAKHRVALEAEEASWHIQMPGHDDGLRLCEKLAALYPESRTIVLTGQYACASVVAARQVGAFACVAKPIGIDELDRLVVRAMTDIERRSLDQLVYAPRLSAPDRTDDVERADPE